MKTMKTTPFTFAFYTQAHEQHPERNEDTILVDRSRGLTAVFDGVGGAEAGEVASQLGARTIRRAWRLLVQQQQPDDSSNLLLLNNDLDIESMLHELLQEAQDAITAEGERRVNRKRAKAKQEETKNPETKADGEKEKDKFPETTVAVALLCQQSGLEGFSMGIAHVGDSRIYLLRPHQPLRRLTSDDGYFLLKIEDHTINEEDALRIDQATEADQLTETEREIFNKRNGITQCLGHLTSKNPTLNIHTARMVVTPGDCILLCSDGIHDNLTDAEIETTLRQEARTTVSRHLIQHAIDRSREECLRAKKDDMSAIVITCNR
jgi:PPM family protein phosphatase